MDKTRRSAIAEQKRLGLSSAGEATKDEVTGKAIPTQLSEIVRAVPWFFGSGSTITHQMKREKDSGNENAAEAIRGKLSAGASSSASAAAATKGFSLKIKTVAGEGVGAENSSGKKNTSNGEKEDSGPRIGHPDQPEKKKDRRRDRFDDDGDDDPLFAMLDEEVSTAGTSSSSVKPAAAAAAGGRQKLHEMATVAGGKKL